jgi:hypothetical protein
MSLDIDAFFRLLKKTSKCLAEDNKLRYKNKVQDPQSVRNYSYGWRMRGTLCCYYFYCSHN